jgi:hypothetical protein
MVAMTDSDSTSDSFHASPSVSDRPHLLEWHSAHSLALANCCKSSYGVRILRLLAADLAIEALTARRQAATGNGLLRKTA